MKLFNEIKVISNREVMLHFGRRLFQRAQIRNILSEVDVKLKKSYKFPIL